MLLLALRLKSASPVSIIELTRLFFAATEMEERRVQGVRPLVSSRCPRFAIFSAAAARGCLFDWVGEVLLVLKEKDELRLRAFIGESANEGEGRG